MNVQDFLIGMILGVLLCLAFVAIISAMHSPNTVKKEEDPADWWKHGRKQEEDEEEFQ